MLQTVHRLACRQSLDPSVAAAPQELVHLCQGSAGEPQRLHRRAAPLFLGIAAQLLADCVVSVAVMSFVTPFAEATWL